MSTLGKRVIYVGPADDSNHKPLHIEGIAVSAIAPGSILERTAGGLDNNSIPATTFGEQFIIADKDQQRSRSVDEAWTINENMVAIAPRSGEFVNALVKDGEVLVKGDALSRDGVGLLKKAATPPTVGATSEEIVGFADEAITTSGSTLVCVRIA